MIFVDSNIPMYLVGSDDPKKARSHQLVQEVLLAGELLVTDIEVYQEILHRYSAIRRCDAIKPALDTLEGIVQQTLPVDLTHIRRAQEILCSSSQVSARDAVHVAVMESEGISRLLSFDAGFDRFPYLQRIY